jgi:hypothetical protein
MGGFSRAKVLILYSIIQTNNGIFADYLLINKAILNINKSDSDYLLIK